MQMLLDLLGLASEQQLRDIWTRRFHHARGNPDRFRDLMPWEELDRLLTYHRLEPPRLQLVRDGQYLPAQEFIRYTHNHRGERLPHIIPERLSELLRDGYTLILDEVDQASPAAASIARAIEADVRESVQANLYAGWREQPAFRRHWDDHDVIALQVSGRKRWRIYSGGRPFPTQFDVVMNTPPPDDVAWEGLLEPGDALYIPRGWWHEVTSVGESTLHITIGFTNRTGIHLMEWLTDTLRHVEAFRMDLPRFATPEERSRHMNTLREELLRAWDDDVAGRFLGQEDVKSRRRMPIGLPWTTQDAPSPPDDTLLVVAPPRPLAIVESADGKTVTFRAHGSEWRFSTDSRALLERLAAGPATLADLIAAADGSQSADAIRTFAGALLQAGIIAVAGRA